MTPLRSGLSRSLLGLSLIEVIVAIAILAVGVLAALLFQSSTLRTNTDSSLRVQATRVATTEMELRRQTFYDPDDEVPGADGTIACRTVVPGFECRALIENCELSVALGGSSLDCESPDASFTTYQISVRVTDPRGELIDLSSLSPAYTVFGTITPVMP